MTAINNTMVGGVAQCPSLTGELSLIYAWSMVDINDMWPLCGYDVRYGSTNQANSAFHPTGVGKCVLIHVITWITRWRPLNGRRELRVAVWLQKLAHVCGLSLQSVGCTSALLCDATAPLQLQCALWRYISVGLYLYLLYKKIPNSVLSISHNAMHAKQYNPTPVLLICHKTKQTYYTASKPSTLC